MGSTAQVFDEGVRNTPAADVDAREEDAYWEREFRREGYYTRGLDYEDYAPAYCVGYIGYAQYGGSFDEAEKSLCANWERIKGDSRLSLDTALAAMRAAWDRMARRNQREAARKAVARHLFRTRMKMPSFKINAVPLR